MDIFTQEQGRKDLSNAVKVNHHIYDYVFTDSKNERELVDLLNTGTEIEVYAKLPRTFTIPTPVGLSCQVRICAAKTFHAQPFAAYKATPYVPWSARAMPVLNGCRCILHTAISRRTSSLRSQTSARINMAVALKTALAIYWKRLSLCARFGLLTVLWQIDLARCQGSRPDRPGRSLILSSMTRFTSRCDTEATTATSLTAEVVVTRLRQLMLEELAQPPLNAGAVRPSLALRTRAPSALDRPSRSCVRTEQKLVPWICPGFGPCLQAARWRQRRTGTLRLEYEVDDCVDFRTRTGSSPPCGCTMLRNASLVAFPQTADTCVNAVDVAVALKNSAQMMLLRQCTDSTLRRITAEFHDC